ncbi:MAG: glycerophosphodiester phosphodiesterase [Acidimicrobiales bacterium]
MLIVAHRTCPRDAPENSLEGIRTAADQGADFVEVDVRLSADGVPVLLHDPWLVRTTRVPLRLSFVSAPRATRLRLQGTTERLPTFAAGLRQLLALPDLRMAVDVKDPRAAAQTVAAVDEAGARKRVLLWSQHEVCVRYFTQACPDVEVALLRDTHSHAASLALISDAVSMGAQAVSIHWSQVERPILDHAHQQGLLVYAWCKSLDALAARSSLPLDGLVTDWPLAMRTMLPAP